LSPVRKLLSRAPFIAGNEPAYADYILFGTLQWARVVSEVEVLSPDDLVAQWFVRLLNLYGGVGRAERARKERTAEAVQ